MVQDLDCLATPIYAWFVRIYKRLNDDQTRFVKDFGITPSQFGVMSVLSQENGLTFTELARRTVLHGSTLTGLVDRMERKGLVTRTNDANDRRQIQVSLTEQGFNQYRRVPTIDPDGVLCNALRALGEADQADLLRLLRRLGTELGDEKYDELIASVLSKVD